MRATGAALAVILLTLPALAQEGTFHGVGTIVEIAPERPAVTLDHGDIPGLMPAMQMMYAVKSKPLLNGLKVGERVRFDVEGKGYLITAIAPEK